MTVSLDSPLSGGAGEGRQRLQRAAARAVRPNPAFQAEDAKWRATR